MLFTLPSAIPASVPRLTVKSVRCARFANGDQVDILTSKAQHPSTEWERFVVTGKAKAAIRRYVRACKRDQFITLGQEILERLFKGENLEFSEKAW